MALKTIVNSREFPVTVTDSGTFCAEFEGERYYGESLKLLQSKLKDVMVKCQTVRIPATLIVTDSWRENILDIRAVTITGIHGRTRDLTYRDAKGEAGTASRHRELYQPLTQEQIQELRTLWQEKRTLEKRWTAKLKALELDAEAEVERAAYLGSEPPTDQDVDASTPMLRPKGQRTKK